MRGSRGFARAAVLFTLGIGLLSPLQAEKALDWNPHTQPAIRSHLLECKTFLSMATPTVNDSVGMLLSTHEPDDFRAAIQEVLHEKGREALKGSQLFVTGLTQEDAEGKLYLLRKILREQGLSEDDIELKPMRVPASLIESHVQANGSKLLEKIRYWFPSKELDYQSPEKAEVISGLVSSAGIEIPNVIFLIHALKPVDAALTITSHLVVLTLYSIYKKAMVNWLLRPGTTKLQSFLKQASLSMPFLLNYHVFGNFSKIVEHFKIYGWEATARAFPAEMANFAATQGLTAFLQTLFYNIVVTHGVRAWENNQVGAENSRLARSVSNYLLMPILAADAIFIAMASAGATDASTLWTYGSFSINQGHVALGGLTLVGGLISLYPKVLQPSLRVYAALERFFFRKKEKQPPLLRN